MTEQLLQLLNKAVTPLTVQKESIPTIKINLPPQPSADQSITPIQLQVSDDNVDIPRLNRQKTNYDFGEDYQEIAGLKLKHKSTNFEEKHSQYSQRKKEIRKNLKVINDNSVLERVISFENADGERHEDLFVNILVKTLSYKQKERPIALLNQLVPQMQKIGFFKERNLSNNSMIDFMQRIKLEKHPQKKELIRIGSTGDKFYLILAGVVEIQLPDQKQLETFNRLGPEIERENIKYQSLQQKIEDDKLLLALKLSEILKLNVSKPNFGKDDPFEVLEQGIKTQSKTLRSLFDYIKELEHLRYVQLMNPFSHLGLGLHFGELALAKSETVTQNFQVTRQATVFCLTECIFASINKQDYQEVIALADMRRLDNMIQFLKNVPFLQKLTRGQLRKLLKGTVTKDYMRHQVVCSQGERSNYLYIVHKGEFETSIHVETKKSQDNNSISDGQVQIFKQFLSQSGKEISQEKIKTRREKIEQDKNKLLVNADARLSLLGPGLVFGDDDIITNRPYKATLKCFSNTGQLFQIKEDEFLRIFKTEGDSWQVQFRLAKDREISEQKALRKFSQIQIQQLNSVLVNRSEISPKTIECENCAIVSQNMSNFISHMYSGCKASPKQQKQQQESDRSLQQTNQSVGQSKSLNRLTKEKFLLNVSSSLIRDYSEVQLDSEYLPQKNNVTRKQSLPLLKVQKYGLSSTTLRPIDQEFLSIISQRASSISQLSLNKSQLQSQRNPSQSSISSGLFKDKSYKMPLKMPIELIPSRKKTQKIAFTLTQLY